MDPFRCKNCGGNLIPIPGEEGRAKCDSCERISVIPTFSDEQRMDRNNRGIDFRRARAFDQALELFSAIVNDNPKDAQAHWDMMLCRFGINYEKDYRTGQYIPTCDRLSQFSVYDDPDYRAAMQYADARDKAYYQEEGEHIERIRLGMMELAAKAEAYDVFICFKDTVDGTKDQRTEDSHIAHDIYMELTNKGYRVFFSRVTLKQEHLGQEWEPVIYSALNTAKIMLVVGTSRANMESPWVKNEWSRFLSVRAKDRTKSIITCYDSRNMEERDIPPELKALEYIDLRDNAFYKYIVQTAFTHCNKTETKTSAVQQKSAANYAKRALQSLEDSDWDKADEMLEEALDLDPENGEAHLGKLLLSLRCRRVEELEKEDELLSNNSSYSRIMKYASPERKNQIMAINQVIKKRIEEKQRSDRYAACVEELQNITISKEAAALAEEFEAFGDYKEAVSYVDRCHSEAQRLKRVEEQREEAQRKEKEAEEKRKAEEQAEAERLAKIKTEEQRKESARKARILRRKKRRKRIRNAIFLLVILGALFYKFVWIERAAAQEAYTLAQEYEAQGDYRNATEQYFIAAEKNYKDAEEQARKACELWLGMEPVSLSQEEYPWWGVDDDGGLTFDMDCYDATVEFELPTILDGKLVTGISEGCFQDMEGLKSLDLPKNFTWIGARAFRNCYNLTQINMTAVEEIGEGAFSNCKSLTNITLPDTCVSIGNEAFKDCSYVNQLTLNNGLQTIGQSAFSGCISLATVTIPSTVTLIDYEAFAYTPITGLTIEDGASGIGARAFAFCESLTELFVPGSVKEIGGGAFYGCAALTSVTFNGTQHIGTEAFEGCGALTTVSFGDGLETIGDNAFSGAGLSGTITIPDGITSIGGGAFYDCDGLYEVYVGSSSGYTVGTSCFKDCEVLNGVYFGSGLTELMESALDCCRQMTWVSLPEGLVTIGPDCFGGSAISEINIPTSVTSIGECAFYGCNNLQGAHIPAGVTIIESECFAYCGSMWWLWFEEPISIIRDDATMGTDNLGYIYYGGSSDAWYYNVSKGNNQQIEQATLVADYFG